MFAGHWLHRYDVAVQVGAAKAPHDNDPEHVADVVEIEAGGRDVAFGPYLGQRRVCNQLGKVDPGKDDIFEAVLKIIRNIFQP